MNLRGIELLKKFEGFREYAYPDPASDLAKGCLQHGLKLRWGYAPARELMEAVPPSIKNLSAAPWTCGYGETKGVTPETKWSKSEAEIRLKERYSEFEQATLRLCQVKPNANQAAALTSLCYNIGTGGFARSSVLKAHNRGDALAAAKAFLMWNKSGGRVYAGLSRRRTEESDLYLTPVALQAPAPLPPPVPDAPPPSAPAPSPAPAQPGLLHWLSLLIAFFKRKRN